MSMEAEPVDEASLVFSAILGDGDLQPTASRSGEGYLAPEDAAMTAAQAIGRTTAPTPNARMDYVIRPTIFSGTNSSSAPP
jgi:hypothetical protein